MEKPGGPSRQRRGIGNPTSPTEIGSIKPPGDRKVARMGGRCKGNGRPFPTFAAENRGSKKFSLPCVEGREEGRSQEGEARSGYDPAGVPFPQLFLQLPLQRLDLFGQRRIPGHQCLNLAHGVQHRGVVAPAEPAADFGQ